MSSQKRAAADGECREENLLQETASKEAAMATRMEEVQAELKQTRLALSNTHAEIERLGVLSTQLKKVKFIWEFFLIVTYSFPQEITENCNLKIVDVLFSEGV